MKSIAVKAVIKLVSLRQIDSTANSTGWRLYITKDIAVNTSSQIDNYFINIIFESKQPF